MKTAEVSTGKVAALTPKTRVSVEEPTPELDLLQLGRTLWRGKFLILLAMLLSIAACILYIIYVATPTYRATSVVSLQNRNEQVVDFENVLSGLGGDQASINTEVEVLRSRGLLEKLVVQLNLEEDPEFNVYLNQPASWSPGELLRMLTGGERLDPTDGRVRDKTIDTLIEAIAISNVRQSYVFRITVTTTDPAKSALIADTLAEIYISDQIDVKFVATSQASKWLTQRVGELQVELETALNSVKDFNSSTELVSAAALEALNRQLKDFRERRSTTVAAEIELAKRVSDLETAEDSGLLDLMAALAADSELTQLLVQMGAEENADRTAFNNRFAQILESARIELERNLAQSSGLSRSILTLEAQVADQSADLLRLEQLQREAAASQQIYEYFLGRLKEISVQQGIQQADSRVLSRAVTPEKPAAPRKALLLFMFALAGVVIGSVVVLVREIRNNGFRTSAQMEDDTGTAVIGQVPRAPYARRKRVLDYVVSKPTSAMVEAVRNLRTSILLSSVDREPKVIMMTSSVPGEGKTTLSLSLAHNLGSMGKKVLIIEGDLRRRTFREFFDLRDQKGVLAAVVGGHPLKEVVYHNDNLDIDILIGEQSGTNAADFFSSERFAKFLTSARKEYDYIIIDTPPVLVVPDARVIGQLSDAVVYVVHWDSTSRTQVKQGISSFAMVNTPVTGLVLSQIDPRGMKAYGYGSSYGYYGKGYYDN